MSREIIDREHVGRLMHESWSRTKRAQGFHGPREKCPENPTGKLIRHRTTPTFNNCVCPKQHTDLIPWDDLPEKQKDINRHAFDDVLPYFERLLAAERERLQNEIQAYQSDPRYDNRYLQGQDDMRKQLEPLLQAEREKVREMCSNKAENTIYYREVDVLETDPNRLKKQIAVHIRQLDLTQPESDLAASSAEEGGDAK